MEGASVYIATISGEEIKHNVKVRISPSNRIWVSQTSNVRYIFKMKALIKFRRPCVLIWQRSKQFSKLKIMTLIFFIGKKTGGGDGTSYMVPYWKVMDGLLDSSSMLTVITFCGGCR